MPSPECQPSLWSGAGRGRAASSFRASGIAVGEPPVCSLSPWTLFSFSSRGRGSAAHLFSYTWLPGVQGDLGQSGNASFKLPFPLGTPCLSWPGSAQYLQLLILALLVSTSEGKIHTPVFQPNLPHVPPPAQRLSNSDSGWAGRLKKVLSLSLVALPCHSHSQLPAGQLYS